MLRVATIALTLAVAAGCGLAAFHMRTRDGTRRPPAWAGVLHGTAGALGLGALVLLLRGPPRGVATGTADFGLAAAVLLAAALLVGLLIPVTRRGRGLSATIVAIHGGIAITGFAVFLAWASFD
jgi:hypothetical protein